MAVVDPTKTEMPSPYTVSLSSNFSRSTAFPLEFTFAEIEPHGAVVLYRFTSGEYAEKFELSGAEFVRLIATARRRRRLLERATQSAYIELEDLPF